MPRSRLAFTLLILILAAACSIDAGLQTTLRTSADGITRKTATFEVTAAIASLTLSPESLTTEQPTSTIRLDANNTPAKPASETPPPATEPPLPTVTPTYAILRGKVLVRANCRYGPGAPYLYKYGLVPGSNLEIIGRTDSGSWILIQAIGGKNPCWVKASLMDVKGDVMAVQPTYIPLPASPYYGPLKGVSARRDGNTVTVFWSPLSLRAGDDSEQTPYVIEAWVCRAGEIVFTPVAAYGSAVEIQDETGCSEPSHGRITAAEKHGYTPFVEIPWP
jgi:hypothetical protein